MLWSTRYCQPQDHFYSTLPQMWTSPALIHFVPTANQPTICASWQKAEKHTLKVWKTGGLWTVNGVITAVQYRNMTLHLMIITCSQSGTNDYVVSYLLLRFVFSFTTFLVFSNPKQALLLKKQEARAPREQRSVSSKGGNRKRRSWVQATKKDRFQILPLTWRMSGATGVSVSAVSQIKPTLMKRPS